MDTASAWLHTISTRSKRRYNSAHYTRLGDSVDFRYAIIHFQLVGWHLNLQNHPRKVYTGGAESDYHAQKWKRWQEWSRVGTQVHHSCSAYQVEHSSDPKRDLGCRHGKNLVAAHNRCQPLCDARTGPNNGDNSVRGLALLNFFACDKYFLLGWLEGS